MAQSLAAMETGTGMVHHHQEEEEEEVVPANPLNDLSGHICQMCGGTVGFTAAGDIFVACNVCAFPTCQACYEYERSYGNQSCFQCKTRYKRHKGSPGVDGDQEEEDDAYLDTEFNHQQGNGKVAYQRKLQDQGEDVESVHGEMHDATFNNQSFRSPSVALGSGESTYSAIDPSLPVPEKNVEPSKDVSSYGLGDVDWKEKVEGWKFIQEKHMQIRTKSAEGKGGDAERSGSIGEHPHIDLRVC